jgi:hypothetical protein
MQTTRVRRRGGLSKGVWLWERVATGCVNFNVRESEPSPDDVRPATATRPTVFTNMASHAFLSCACTDTDTHTSTRRDSYRDTTPQATHSTQHRT